MLRYFLARILALIPILIMIAVVAFVLLRLIPGDPASAMLPDEATIEEIVSTDILLHVIDSSNNNIKYQIDSVLNAMVDLGISDKPILNILNKSDIDNLINTDDLEAFINSKFKNNLGIIKASAINKTGIDEIQKLLKFELFGITV